MRSGNEAHTYAISAPSALAPGDHAHYKRRLLRRPRANDTVQVRVVLFTSVDRGDFGTIPVRAAASPLARPLFSRAKA
jgi:hypothetical protein